MTDRLVCAWCGQRFDRPAAMGRPPIYCSHAHRQRDWEYRKMMGLLADKDDEIARLKAKLRKVKRSR